MESKGKNVDVSLNVSGTPRCDEASSSGYSDLPKRSEGEDVNVNLNISGAPRCDEAPSSSSSSDLWQHIFELWKLREKGNHKKARSLGHFPWPDVPALKKLKEIVSFGTHLPINEIDGAVQAILKQIGRVNVATAAALVVACILERYDFYTPGEKFWHLVKEMHYLAIGLKRWSENPARMPEVMEEATSLIIEGVLLFSAQFDCSRSASEVHAIREMLNIVHMRIKITVHVFTPEKYPTHAVFKMEALVDATNNFHEDNKLGEGGSGVVYKGTTHDGKQIAVKKMSLTSNEGRTQFRNEKLLIKVQHPNLVNLLGSCEQESQGFIVYEYLRNKSLDKFLFDPEKRKELNWQIRFEIILGTASGLCYLNEVSEVRIVHRDIKPSNILLDQNMSPKIADFGTANHFPEDRTHVTPTSVVGTLGYMAPECLMEGKLSVRADVYSFGIVLFELLIGEKISSDAFFDRVWQLYKTKKFVPTIDPTMTRTEKAKALRCIQVGLLCIQEHSRRPKMSLVIKMLSTSDSLPVPKKPMLVSSPRRSCFDSMLQRGGGK